MNCIKGENIGFQYNSNSQVMNGASFSIELGKMTAILGKNGCGKSTFIKLITALLPLSSGKIMIDNIEINSTEGIKKLRQRSGIVFQNPDNQFVAPIIEDDIRFGLENHNIPPNEQNTRITSSLNAVNLAGFEKRSFVSLSGGQKQRAAVAGILAIQNDILIFDEATSMLDPDGKKDLLSLIQKLQHQGKTIIVITQNISDILQADSVLLMADKQIIAAGTPRGILTNRTLLEKSGIQIPFPVRIYHDLLSDGIKLPYCPLTQEELAEELCSLI